MKKVKLGHSDLYVSSICLGSMTWGEQNTTEEAFEQIRYAYDQGINFIDTAEMYPVPPFKKTQGQTEEILGQYFQKYGGRENFIIATKVTAPSDHICYIRDGELALNKKNMEKALKQSLQRLQMDYIDLYQIHWPQRQSPRFGTAACQEMLDDNGVSIKETLEALTGFVKEGLIRYIGVSNETPWGVMTYLRHYLLEEGERIVSIQNPYSLLNRTFEQGLSEIVFRENVSLLAYSPLAFGVLTGKYLFPRQTPGRLDLYPKFDRYKKKGVKPAVEQYERLAKSQGLSLTELALAYVYSRSFIASTIIGASKIEQLQENVLAQKSRLSDEVIEKIEKIHIQYKNLCP